MDFYSRTVLVPLQVAVEILRVRGAAKSGAKPENTVVMHFSPIEAA